MQFHTKQCSVLAALVVKWAHLNKESPNRGDEARKIKRWWFNLREIQRYKQNNLWSQHLVVSYLSQAPRSRSCAKNSMWQTMERYGKKGTQLGNPFPNAPKSTCANGMSRGSPSQWTKLTRKGCSRPGGMAGKDLQRAGTAGCFGGEQCSQCPLKRCHQEKSPPVLQPQPIGPIRRTPP